MNNKKGLIEKYQKEIHKLKKKLKKRKTDELKYHNTNSSFLKRWIEIKYLKPFDKFMTLTSLLFVLIGIISLLFLVFIVEKNVLISFYNNIIEPLGFEFNNIGFYIKFILLPLALLSFIIYYITSAINPKLKIGRFWYLIVGILLFFIITIFSLSIINNTYGEDSYHTFYPENKSLTSPSLSCSLDKYDKIVIGDLFVCRFSIHIHGENITSYSIYNNSNFTNYNRTDIKIKIAENANEIKITAIGSNQTTFIYTMNTNHKFTTKEYYDLQHNKIFLIITVISISLFSVIIAMNNLRQLLEKDKPQRIILECPYQKHRK